MQVASDPRTDDEKSLKELSEKYNNMWVKIHTIDEEISQKQLERKKLVQASKDLDAFIHDKFFSKKK